MLSPAIQKFQDCKAILLDFGGTLDSDGGHWLDRFYSLYEKADLNLPLPDIKRAFYHADEICCADPEVNSMGFRELMSLHVRLQFEALNLHNIEAEQRLSESFCRECETFLRRNARILHNLSRIFRLGVISNFYGNVAVLCEEAGLFNIMDIILDSTIVEIKKPDPQIFQLALKDLRLAPQEVAFVGDSFEHDMIPAQCLGMKTIWLKGPNPRVPPNPGPVDCIISSLADLETLVI